MGKYDGWRRFFEELRGKRQTLEFGELEAPIVGSLPPSARKYQAWWSGDRYYAIWREYGWSASPDLFHERVTFTRGRKPRRRPGADPETLASGSASDIADLGERLVLVGCVKSKVDYPAPAKDLYDSPLWHKRRRYAESSGMPWAILSAEYGMVDPDMVLEPYDRYLGSEPSNFRRSWSERTAKQVLKRLNEIDLEAVEVHAGSAYLENGLRQRLEQAGVVVVAPLKGLGIGQQLRWYSVRSRVSEAVEHLSAFDSAVGANSFDPKSEAASHPGLYSWWVDDVGREVFESSLETDMPGLIYAGQAGATSSRSGKKSPATLGSRLDDDHLGGTVYGSTLRKSLAALLLSPLDLRVESSDRLVAGHEDKVSEWMRRHLSVALYPYGDRDLLSDFEDEVLGILDPPINLQGRPQTPARQRLTTLRRRISRPELSL